ncbi:MAG TPA: D-TA family PLP-dependent enzyme [Planctomycetaceae bacterium]|jgi:D-serine deaminase-like pyridoxal phosphate-dependent protein
MDACYRIEETREIISPALIVFRELFETNLDSMIRIAGSPSRLRPHCKTHKMPQVTRIELARGIAKHKCATFAEAEMLATAGALDILLSYNVVGPNITRAVEFVKKFPQVSFQVQADHPKPIAALGQALSAAGKTVEVLLDVDVGQHRTGIPAGPQAQELYQAIANTPGLRAGGLHVYDGHQHQKSREERAAAVNSEWERVAALRDEIQRSGLKVPRIVCGGTGSFPIYAEKHDPAIELSPGTCIFNDAGYSETFTDLVFKPATAILTRVISRPTADRITLDLGYKAVASDPPAGKRLTLPDLPDAEQVLQNEEHLVVRTSRAGEFQPGDELLAIPRHICPSVALHKQVYVVSQGKLVDRWDVVARDRWLTI